MHEITFAIHVLCLYCIHIGIVYECIVLSCTVELHLLYIILLRPYMNTPSWQRFIVSHNNAFRSLHNLYMRCSASSMFVNAVVDSCSMCIRKIIFSLMSRLNTPTNVIVQCALNSDVYTTSEVYQRWVKALYT